ncbi:hypothetical protein [Enterococcus sp. HY326]|uniref:hypothetical protein n=1 Tax=Enterococcus sp. HY326 TaxID=2971265 RepID=UPI002240720D|nr:hypothetical protein [Enterococcus sp. HY326]
MSIFELVALALCCLCFFLCGYSVALLALYQRWRFGIIGIFFGMFSLVYFFYVFRYQLYPLALAIYFEFSLFSAVFFNRRLKKWL